MDSSPLMFLNSQRHPGPPLFFFFNDTATTEIYTLSLHDALPISLKFLSPRTRAAKAVAEGRREGLPPADRKSTRLNSSHSQISYAVFCLKKKKTTHLAFSPRTITCATLTILRSSSPTSQPSPAFT